MPTGPATKSPVLIGYATESDITGFAASLGVGGISNVNVNGELSAIVNNLNKHGGIAGHKIQTVIYNYNTTERVTNPVAADQAACADWTQDHHVLAVVDATVGISDSAVILSCLEKAHVPLVSDWPTDGARDSVYASDPLLTSPSTMAVDSYIPAEVDQLYAHGFFSRWNSSTGGPGTAPVKVGVESFDDAAGQHYVAVLRAALAQHGLKLDAVESHARGNPVAAAAGASSAVLRFRAEGITHVFYANVLFYSDAQTQGYHPRYDVDDLIGPSLLAANVGRSQLHGAMGAGYSPLLEVNGAPNPNPAGKQCLAVMRAGGQVPTSQLARLSMFEMCSHWYLLQRIFANVSTPSAATFAAGLAAVGNSFAPADTYAADFGPNRHFGADEIRNYAYVDGCSCFKFTSTVLHSAP